MKWDESKHPRDNDGKFTKRDFTDMNAADLKEYILSLSGVSTSYETIKLPDEQLPYSVGAKWINHEILLSDGKYAKFVEGTKIQNKEVFAGMGCKRKIDCVDSLVERFGGNSEHWMKVKGIAEIVLPNGELQKAEIHWYEEPSVGKKVD